MEDSTEGRVPGALGCDDSCPGPLHKMTYEGLSALEPRALSVASLSNSSLSTQVEQTTQTGLESGTALKMDVRSRFRTPVPSH